MLWVTEGHVTVEGHDHEHSAQDTCMIVVAKSLKGTVVAKHEPLQAGKKNVCQQARNDGVCPIVSAHIAEEKTHGLMEGQSDT